MKRSEVRELFLPWAGLAVGVLVTGIVHQFGSEGVFDYCRPISPLPLLIVSTVGIGITILAALASSRVVRDRAETQARKLVAVISIGSAALFVFAMLLPMIASLILPPCFQ